MGIHPDLKAANEILGIMERSKAGSDTLFDLFPGVFVIANQEAQVLKGNHGASALFNCETELLLGRNLSELFTPENWIEFMQEVKKLGTTNEKTTEFELPVGLTEAVQADYWWQVTPFELSKNSPYNLVSVIGKDVSDIRKAHAQFFELAKDLEITRAVQSLLLPKESSSSNDDFSSVAYYRPADQAGGDWWWIDRRLDRSALVLLGDVTGHGAGSAMVTAAVAGSFLTARKILSGFLTREEEVPRILNLLNDTLRRTTDYWMTLSAIEIFPDRNEIKWWNLGGPSLMLQRANGEIEVIRSPGSPLGSETLEVAVQIREFCKDDRLFCFTDGIIDFQDPNGRRFGMLRMRDLFASAKDLTIQEARQKFKTFFETALSGKANRDDAAFILIQRH